jgi:hypothetical protein
VCGVWARAREQVAVKRNWPHIADWQNSWSLGGVRNGEVCLEAQMDGYSEGGTDARGRANADGGREGCAVAGPREDLGQEGWYSGVFILFYFILFYFMF